MLAPTGQVGQVGTNVQVPPASHVGTPSQYLLNAAANSQLLALPSVGGM